jgi:hypothetical protein
MRSCSEPNVQSRSLGSSIYYNSQRRKDYRVFLPTLLYSESVGPTEIAKQLRRAISASVDRVARRAVEPSGNPYEYPLDRCSTLRWPSWQAHHRSRALGKPNGLALPHPFPCMPIKSRNNVVFKKLVLPALAVVRP